MNLYTCYNGQFECFTEWKPFAYCYQAIHQSKYFLGTQRNW